MVNNKFVRINKSSLIVTSDKYLQKLEIVTGFYGSSTAKLTNREIDKLEEQNNLI